MTVFQLQHFHNKTAKTLFKRIFQNKKQTRRRIIQYSFPNIQYPNIKMFHPTYARPWVSRSGALDKALHDRVGVSPLLFLDCRLDPKLSTSRPERAHCGCNYQWMLNAIEHPDFAVLWGEFKEMLHDLRPNIMFPWMQRSTGKQTIIGFFCREGKHRSVALAHLVTSFASCHCVVSHFGEDWHRPIEATSASSTLAGTKATSASSTLAGTKPGFCGYIGCAECQGTTKEQLMHLHDQAMAKGVNLDITK